MIFYIQLGSQLPSQPATEKKWEQLHLTLDNSNLNEERQSNETNLFKTMRVRVIECESFAQKVVLL